MFEAMLVELNNTSSPSLLLDDYNYFINKAIDMYINKRYTNYDTTQQTTDDLRVLKSTAILPVNKKVFTDENTDEHSEKLTELMELIKQDKSFEAMAEVSVILKGIAARLDIVDKVKLLFDIFFFVSGNFK